MKVFVCTREHGFWETYKQVFAVTSTEEKASEFCVNNNETWEEFKIDY